MERHFDVIPETPFRDALLRYGEVCQRRNPEDYQDRVRLRLQRLLDVFGQESLSGLTTARLQDYANQRMKTVTEGTVKRDLATVRAIMNKAHREGMLVTVPPFPKLKASKARSRWLTKEEEARLFCHAAPHLRRLMMVAVDTGGRRGELLSLDWRSVDLSP